MEFIGVKEKECTGIGLELKCVVCRKFLKVFEENLCSCKKPVCMNHRLRNQHECTINVASIHLVKVVNEKVTKI